ncbi:hypothetical protein CAPTEDRAFT_191454, partial [Capitella teleta]
MVVARGGLTKRADCMTRLKLQTIRPLDFRTDYEKGVLHDSRLTGSDCIYLFQVFGVLNKIFENKQNILHLQTKTIQAILNRTCSQLLRKDWPEKNKLLKSVDFDIREKLYIAGCRAMGLIYILVMLPFEERLRRGTILDLNADLEQLHSTVEEWSRDGTIPLSKKGSIFEPDQPLTSPLADCLVAPSEDPELDGMTKVAVELISLKMMLLIERQAESQLP